MSDGVMGQDRSDTVWIDASTALLLGIAVLTVLLRFWGISSESVWFDEAVSYRYLHESNPVTFLMRERELDPPMAPAYFLMEWCWAKIFGVSSVAMRSLSIIFGTLTVFTVYLLGRRIRGEAAGLLSAACLAVCLNHIYYSQEIRMYALFVLLAALSTLSVIEYRAGGGKAWFAAALGANVLLPWTHIFAVFFVFVQAWMVAFLWRKDLRTLIHWALPQGVNALIWYFLWVRHIDLDKLVLFVHEPVGFLEGMGQVAQAYVSCAGSPFLDFYVLSSIQNITAVVALAAIAWFVRSRWRDWDVWLLVSVTAVPLVMFLFSQLFVPMFLQRYVQYCCIPIYVLLISGLLSLPFGRWLGVAVVAILLFHTIATERPYRQNFNKVREIIPIDAVTIVAPGHLDVVLECLGFRKPVPAWNMVSIRQEAAKSSDFWVILLEPSKGHDVTPEKIRRRFRVLKEYLIDTPNLYFERILVFHCLHKSKAMPPAATRPPITMVSPSP